MKKRMFTDDITGSGKFLRMSEGSQLLYFHLGLNADDDGVVDAFQIMRMTNAKEDDLVLLVEREFVIMLDPKELVIWISGWQDFNKIDPRMKEDSKYLPLLLAKIQGIEIVSSTKQDANRRRYQRLKVERDLKKNDPPGISTRSTRDTRDDPTSSIDKYSLVKNTTLYVAEATEEIKNIWKINVGTTLRNHVEENLKAFNYLKKELGEELPQYLQAVRMIRADQYAKRTLQGKLINYVGLKEKLEEVESYMAAKIDNHKINNDKL